MKESEKKIPDGELSDDEVEAVNGGVAFDPNDSRQFTMTDTDNTPPTNNDIFTPGNDTGFLDSCN